MIGKMFIEWGAGKLAWVQYARKHDKVVTELRLGFTESPFPGYLHFIEQLSRLSKLPKEWATVLSASRGVYLLTCPKSKEHYVGSAIGSDGFWGRWLSYMQTGHGGNKGLLSRPPSDYQVTILEVAGTTATGEDILQMEGLWQRKLQSIQMGLNMNSAGGSMSAPTYPDERLEEADSDEGGMATVQSRILMPRCLRWQVQPIRARGFVTR